MSKGLAHIICGITNITSSKTKDGSTTIYDKVIYKIPFGLIGNIAHKLFIKKRLTEIFNYRKTRINQLFADYV